MTAFFPRTFYGAEPSFNPLFRLLDDFESYSREAQGQTGSSRPGHRHSRARAFSPRFDVRETDDAYELHGELPGIARDNIQIEFTEPQALVVRGRVERTYTAGTPAPAAVQDAAQPAQLTEKAADEEPTAAAAAKEAAPSHHTTVTDEQTENDSLEHGTPVDEQTDAVAPAAAPAAPAAPQEKYWATERSIGEFSRTFSFPARVDQDAVSASLQNGILTVVVPKAKKLESRRIAIN